ncbi:hypothetical protein [Streptomyces atroolivaceus]|uniref:hypothetical protein n=1 Tax=Streptomyces atroolivaceus TaxID=66869 RepID=UPI0037B327FA
MTGAQGGTSDAKGVLDGSSRYDEKWLSQGDKRIVPVPAGSRTDDSLVRRLAEGCRTAGGDAVLAVDPGTGSSVCAGRRAPADPRLLGMPPPLLLVTTDLTGAILFPAPGHALVANTSAFLEGAAPKEVERGRARFSRYARATAGKWSGPESTARSFPPSHIAWKRPGGVPAGTATARQLTFMRDFAAGRCTGADFAVGWPDARRHSQQRGERVRDPLETLFDRVFSLLEDYSIDPVFTGPAGLSDEEVRQSVVRLMHQAE